MKIRYPSYNKSIVNLACSIINHYGGDIQHNTLPILDDHLKKDYKNIVVMLLDGLGVDALEKNLPEDSFLRRHFKESISSVFPPTTTAATTSIESGLTPYEHGWLGWSLYFSEIDKIVNAFINTVAHVGSPAADYHVAREFIPYESIFQKINETGNAHAYNVSPFGTNIVSTHEEMFLEVKRLCETDEKKYIYTYYPQPDGDMHKYGCYSPEARWWIETLDKGIEEMCKKLKNTLLIVTADHGHINIKYKFMSHYPKLSKMLVRPISIESRAVSFHVKEDFITEFKDEFLSSFGDDFILFTKNEVIEEKLFGPGKAHIKLDEFLGDYLAVATGDIGIAHSEDSHIFRSNHAGLTEQEMLVPFIVFES